MFKRTDHSFIQSKCTKMMTQNHGFGGRKNKIISISIFQLKMRQNPKNHIPYKAILKEEFFYNLMTKIHQKYSSNGLQI